MLLFKDPRANRSNLDAHSRQIPIVPVHRESITYPLPPPEHPRRSRAPAEMADQRSSPRMKGKLNEPPMPSIFQLPPLRQAAPPPDGLPEEHFSQWMAAYGREPKGDMKNGCLGVFCTPALHGKTHWRLKRIVSGDSPHDDEWQFRKTFNGACMAHWATSFFFVDMLGGPLVGIQRSQIRGTYGIDGSIAKDMMLGICLPKCTQVHNDREVRAREGQMGLRNSKEYQAFRAEQRDTIISQQPRSQPQMSYAFVAPNARDTAGDHNIAGLVDDTNNTITRIKGKDRTWQRAGPQTSSPKREPPAQHKNGRKENGPCTSRSRIMDGGFDGANPMVIVAYVQDDCSVQPATKLGKHSHSRKKGMQPPKLAGVPEEVNSASRLQLNPRRIASNESHDPRKREVQAYDAKNSTPASFKGKRSLRRGKKDLSYVHDFSDSPIDKAVLEHYEIEERNSQENAADHAKAGTSQHTFGDCTKVPGRGNSDQVNGEHNLKDCGGVSRNASIHSHTLEECDSDLVSRNHSLAQHTIDDCDLQPGPKKFSLHEHTLAEDELIPGPGLPQKHNQAEDIQVTASKKLVQSPSKEHTIDSDVFAFEFVTSNEHNLSDDIRVPRVQKATRTQEHRLDTDIRVPSGNSGQQHDLADDVRISRHPEAKSLVARQHTLADDPYVSAIEHVKPYREHTLSSDIRVPVVATPKEHSLKDDVVVPSRRKANDHTLEECDPREPVPNRQHALADCSNHSSLDDTYIPEHELSECEPLVDQSNEINEHRLSQCSPQMTRKRRSVSMGSGASATVVIEQSVIKNGHRLVSCPNEFNPPTSSFGPAKVLNIQEIEPVPMSEKEPQPFSQGVKENLSEKIWNDKVARIRAQSRKSDVSERKERGGKIGMVRSMSPAPSESSAAPSFAAMSLAHILKASEGKRKTFQLDGAVGDSFTVVEL